MGVITRLFFGLVGVGAVVWGVKELRLAGAASEKPTRMTCKELGEKGAGDNAHVVLTDFVLTDDIVYEHKKKTSDKQKWTKVWVPAVPSDSAYAKAVGRPGADAAAVPLPRPVSVIVVSKDTKNDEELDALREEKELEGMVVNLISSLGREERRLLEESYGDVSRAQIFEVGRKPANTVLSLAAIGAGAAVTLAVLLSFVRRRRPQPEPAAG